jgi:hypothetical protein
LNERGRAPADLFRLGQGGVDGNARAAGGAERRA